MKKDLSIKNKKISFLFLLISSSIVLSCNSKSKREPINVNDTIAETISLDPIPQDSIVLSQSDTLQKDTLVNPTVQTIVETQVMPETNSNVVSKEGISSNNTNVNKSSSYKVEEKSRPVAKNGLVEEMNDVGEYFYMNKEGNFETLKEKVITNNQPVSLKKEKKVSTSASEEPKTTTLEVPKAKEVEVVEESTSVSTDNNNSTVQEKIIEIKEN